MAFCIYRIKQRRIITYIIIFLWGGGGGGGVGGVHSGVLPGSPNPDAISDIHTHFQTWPLGRNHVII